MYIRNNVLYNHLDLERFSASSANYFDNKMEVNETEYAHIILSALLCLHESNMRIRKFHTFFFTKKIPRRANP